jgi:hypothetical protein
MGNIMSNKEESRIRGTEPRSAADVWDKILSCRTIFYHLELKLSCGTNGYHLELMLKCGAFVTMWKQMLSSGQF